MCHTSRVIGHMSNVTSKNIILIFLLSAGASLWRVCYQCGLLCLVSVALKVSTVVKATTDTMKTI